jgi:collagen type III alpha
MRRLTLHASALTDLEYTLYTHSLKELAEIDVNQPQGTGGQGADGDDEYYERIRLGVREVRAWSRGRYAGSIDVGSMDGVNAAFAFVRDSGGQGRQDGGGPVEPF